MARRAQRRRRLCRGKDRYHLYVSLACPWAHRTLILRKLKGLDPLFPSPWSPLMLENGWTFDDDFPEATGDTLYQHEFLYQLYLHADPHYTGRVTVPVLWEKSSIRSSAMSRLKSSACSIPPLTAWAPPPAITTRPRCAKNRCAERLDLRQRQ
jgi:putative glutathione S-transferase